MDELSTQLREAVGDPPSTAIDVDRLIAAEQRRSKTRAWAIAGTGVAVVVAAIVAIPVLLTGPAPGGDAAPGGTRAVVDPCHPGAGLPASGVPVVPRDTVRGRPTESRSAAMPRLTVAVLNALQDGLPANVSVKDGLPGCPPEFVSHPDGTYQMRLSLVRGEDTGVLYVFVGPTVADQVGCYVRDDGLNDCDRIDLADGTVVTTRASDSGGVAKIGTQVYRPDGTFVLFVDNHWTSQVPRDAPERILTAEQVIAIGKDPRLTLYP